MLSRLRLAQLLDVLTLAGAPTRLRLMCFGSVGMCLGMGAWVARVSEAASYMSDDPKTCINCHIMFPQYATWLHSSHGRVANCNDCHVPHSSLAAKLFFKAKDGMRHASMFTLRMEPQVIQLSSAAIPVVEANCRRCHQQLVGDVHLRKWQPGDNRCWDCHREVPHGRVQSLSTAYDVNAPQLPGVLDNPHQMQTGDRAPRPAKEQKP